MNEARYKYILYIIVIVILATIGIQVYWNYKNYLNSKQQLINDVQVSLDKAVDDYYAQLAEKNTLAFAFKSPDSFAFVSGDYNGHSIEHYRISNQVVDTFELNVVKGVSVFTEVIADSILKDSILKFKKKKLEDRTRDKKIIELIQNGHSDSVNIAKFRTLTSKVMFSLTHDSLSLKGIDSLLKIELLRKHINVDYGLNYKDANDELIAHCGIQSEKFLEKNVLSTKSESTFLPMGNSLLIVFTNATHDIFKRIIGGILISLLLVLAVISILFYLLHVIKHQKQLAEVKNDLISNITHEFKTPIATIGVAIESIKDFNIISDKDKTKNYLELSSGQLTKLNFMVEKLLETATLDSDDLTLDRESVDIIQLVKRIVDTHQMQTTVKTIEFSCSSNSIIANVDIFHFENTVNNVLDNAIKYGGDKINVVVEQNSISFAVSISDNGNGITKGHKNKIFEKFYRIPKGNTHDIKGFGIGLYYTKKIVEKHGGAIHLSLEKNLTSFKLTFPNG